MAKSTGKVTIKKYANRRLYDTESSTYITLDRLAQMVREGREFEVIDAKSGEDITRQVLTQIIVDEEARGATMLPINFLKQLIGRSEEHTSELQSHVNLVCRLLLEKKKKKKKQKKNPPTIPTTN